LSRGRAAACVKEKRRSVHRRRTGSRRISRVWRVASDRSTESPQWLMQSACWLVFCRRPAACRSLNALVEAVWRLARIQSCRVRREPVLAARSVRVSVGSHRSVLFSVLFAFPGGVASGASVAPGRSIHILWLVWSYLVRHAWMERNGLLGRLSR